MSYITGLRRDLTEWTPQFVKSIDEDLCIGCGRCHKVCVRDVLAYQEDEDDESRGWMTIVHAGNCIGCQACSRACGKKCFSFEPVKA